MDTAINVVITIVCIVVLALFVPAIYAATLETLVKWLWRQLKQLWLRFKK